MRVYEKLLQENPDVGFDKALFVEVCRALYLPDVAQRMPTNASLREALYKFRYDRHREEFLCRYIERYRQKYPTIGDLFGPMLRRMKGEQ